MNTTARIHQAPPHWHGEVEAIVIFTRRLDPADLKKRARREDAVVVGPEGVAVQAEDLRARYVQGRIGGASELFAEVVAIDVELLDDRGGRAHADVEFFEDVVVDERDAYVFVAAAFAGGCVDFAQEVEGGSFAGSRVGG